MKKEDVQALIDEAVKQDTRKVQKEGEPSIEDQINAALKKHKLIEEPDPMASVKALIKETLEAHELIDPDDEPDGEGEGDEGGEGEDEGEKKTVKKSASRPSYADLKAENARLKKAAGRSRRPSDKDKSADELRKEDEERDGTVNAMLAGAGHRTPKS